MSASLYEQYHVLEREIRLDKCYKYVNLFSCLITYFDKLVLYVCR